jgi:tRNA dimethylallyltransferase
MTKLPCVVAVLGPTAVGKTEISIQLAEKLNAEIISVDSRLLYVGMDIGTAKPTHEQRTKVPHHLIDVTRPDDPWTLAKFQEEALKAIDSVLERGRLPLLVGGTGQYLMAVIEGWTPPPRAEDENIREELFSFAEENGSEALHRRLEEVDPVSASRIDYRNIRRVVRALEIHLVSGIPASKARSKTPPSFKLLLIGLSLPRQELYQRIDARIEAMIKAGLVEEVSDLLAAGATLDMPAMSAIGYKQVAEHIMEGMSLEVAKVQMRRLTRQFVRRQANWFKPDDPRIEWFEPRGNVADVVTKRIQAWLDEEGCRQSGGVGL